MKKLICVMAMALAGCATTVPAPKQWTDLFAKDFSNCEVEKGAWRYDFSGCLVPTCDKPIFTKAWYANYELEVIYAMGPKGNSGCLIYDTAHPRAKIEVQMQDDLDPDLAKTLKPYQYSGSLYGHQAAFEKAAKKAGEWNKLFIQCDGDRVRVVLNGVETAHAILSVFKSDTINPDGSEVPPYMLGQRPLAEIPRTGRIGFQGLHGGGEAGVRIKSVKIRAL